MTAGRRAMTTETLRAALCGEVATGENALPAMPSNAGFPLLAN